VRVGLYVTLFDPAYAMPRAELVARARFDADRIADWQRANPAVFDWSYLRSPDAMNRSWRGAIEEFAADFAPDSARYAAATLPTLPYPDRHLALAVSGFLLFVYPELLDTGDHLAALLELSRVTRGEVRVYPLHDTVGAPYAALRRPARAAGCTARARRGDRAAVHRLLVRIATGQRPDARLPVAVVTALISWPTVRLRLVGLGMHTHRSEVTDTTARHIRSASDRSFEHPRSRPRPFLCNRCFHRTWPACPPGTVCHSSSRPSCVRPRGGLS